MGDDGKHSIGRAHMQHKGLRAGKAVVAATFTAMLLVPVAVHAQWTGRLVGKTLLGVMGPKTLPDRLVPMAPMAKNEQPAYLPIGPTPLTNAQVTVTVASVSQRGTIDPGPPPVAGFRPWGTSTVVPRNYQPRVIPSGPPHLSIGYYVLPTRPPRPR